MVQLCLALCDPMVGSPRSGCQHGWVLVRALFLPYRPLPSCPVLTWPFFRESAQGQRRETETQLSEDAFFARPQGIRILVLQPGIEPVPSEMKVWRLNHWTSREFPVSYAFDTTRLGFPMAGDLPLFTTASAGPKRGPST